MRLFVSIDLDGMDSAVRTAQRPFAGIDGLRLVAPSHAHVTLTFLGSVDETRLDAIETTLHEAVDAASVTAFDATFGGYGAFPSYDYISVVWFGVREGSEEMVRLHEAIEEQMGTLGFESEEHTFTPHVTIARMDHAAEKERVQHLLRERNPSVGSMHISEVRLTESTLTADGPEYETVVAVEL